VNVGRGIAARIASILASPLQFLGALNGFSVCGVKTSEWKGLLIVG